MRGRAHPRSYKAEAQGCIISRAGSLSKLKEGRVEKLAVEPSWRASEGSDVMLEESLGSKWPREFVGCRW
jgi:hypothetical protein